jgi:hypothetical protein
MSDLNETDLAGQYYSPAEDKVINLASVSKLWYQEDGIFTAKDRLYFNSCGETYHVDKSTDGISALFNKLADDGTFIQIGEKMVNTKSIQHAHQGKNRLYYTIANNTECEKLTPEESEVVLSKLESLKRFQRIGTHVVNMNKVTNMCFATAGFLTNDRLKINFLGEEDISIEMSEMEAKQIQQAALSRPQFKDIAGDVINVAVAGKVKLKDDMLHIQYPGTECDLKINSHQGNPMENFTEDAGYISITDSTSQTQNKLNTLIASEAWYSKAGMIFSPRFYFNILSDEMSVISHPAQSQSIMDQMRETADYVAIGESVVNINSIGRAYYTGKKLCFSQGTEEYSKRMSVDEAVDILEKILAHDKFIEIDGAAVNAQFASHFHVKSNKLKCTLGQESYTFNITAAEAQHVFQKIKEFGLQKDRQITDIRNNSQDDSDHEAVWDADLLAEIYEELDQIHSRNMLLMTAIMVNTTVNSR